ncbi:hypothetical protein [Aggregatilinea lenta]|uniref:hypothetical protein n=1 Tax=Aggregatilinea lenta TaxID=913108 RepID=UPI000E5A1212|nr:hypothetical protein [Aggregatilinea lenta]
MNVSQTDLQRWLHDNCALCKRQGDRHQWIDVGCPHSSLILWSGPPYSEQDAAPINARLDGECARFKPDVEAMKRREDVQVSTQGK